MKPLIYFRSLAIILSLLVISLPIALSQELNLQYDANGNLITGDSFYREYNELNQLSRIREGNISTGPILEEFIWHPVQERILIKDVFYNGIKNYSVYYVSDDFIRIENSSGNYTEKYIYQDGVLVAQVNNDGNKIAVHNDHIGSVSLLTDSNGNILEETFYSPYGEIISGGKSSRFDYEGKEFDSATQTYDFHFRQINPSIPIWNKPDTVIQNVYDPQSLNRYMFERGNPYGNVDPDGHRHKKGGIKSIFKAAVSIYKAAVTIVKAVVNVYNRAVEAKNTAKENLQKAYEASGAKDAVQGLKKASEAQSTQIRYISGGGSSSGVSTQEFVQSFGDEIVGLGSAGLFVGDVMSGGGKGVAVKAGGKEVLNKLKNWEVPGSWTTPSSFGLGGGGEARQVGDNLIERVRLDFGHKTGGYNYPHTNTEYYQVDDLAKVVPNTQGKIKPIDNIHKPLDPQLSEDWWD